MLELGAYALKMPGDWDVEEEVYVICLRDLLAAPLAEVVQDEEGVGERPSVVLPGGFRVFLYGLQFGWGRILPGPWT